MAGVVVAEVVLAIGDACLSVDIRRQIDPHFTGGVMADVQALMGTDGGRIDGGSQTVGDICGAGGVGVDDDTGVGVCGQKHGCDCEGYRESVHS